MQPRSLEARRRRRRSGKPADRLPTGWKLRRPQHRGVGRRCSSARELLPGRACDEFVARHERPADRPEQIPDFRRLSEILMKRTGWQVVAVPGLVPDDVFFEHLANRRFPAGQFIRRPDQLDYLEEPDVFHDVFGHVPLLMHPVIADYIQAYGVGGLRAQKLGVLDKLVAGLLVHGRVRAAAAEERAAHLRRRHRVVGVRDRLRARGRFAEPTRLRARARDAHALPDRRLPGDLLRHRQTSSELLELAHIDFAPIYDRVKGQTELEPGDRAADGSAWSPRHRPLPRRRTGAAA